MKNYNEFLAIKDLIKNCEYDLAFKKLQVLYNNESNDKFIKFEYAKLLTKIKNKNYKLAKKMFMELSSEDDVFSIFELGKLEVLLGNFESAEKYFLSILEKQPNNTHVKLELARLERKTNNIDKASIIYKEIIALENKPNKNYAFFMDICNAKLELGKLDVEVGKIDEARNIFNELISKKNTNAKLELAKLERKSWNIDKSKKLLLELINDNKKVEYAKLELAKIYIMSGNIEEARSILDELLIIYKNKDVIKLEYGKLEANEGNIKKALYYFNELNKSENINYSLFAKLEIGRLYASIGDFEISRYYFNELLNTKNKGYALLELGRLEYSQGNLDEAKYYYNQLLNGKQKDRLCALLELGRLESNNGNIDLATKYFNQLLGTSDEPMARMEMLMMDIKYELYNDALEHLNYLTKIKYQKYKLRKYQIYLKYKLGMLKNEDYTSKYFDLQLTDYNTDLALDHIYFNFDEEDRKINNASFNSNVNIEDIYKYALKELENYKCSNLGIYDEYIIDLNYNIGICNNLNTSLLKVVTICNTKNIISMYPTLSKYKVRKLNKIKIKK